MNEILSYINPVLITLSSLIIIVGKTLDLLRRKSETKTLFLYESQIKTRNGYEIHRKTDNDHLEKLREENEQLKTEMSALKNLYGPFTKPQRLFIWFFVFIAGLLMLQWQWFQKKPKPAPLSDSQETDPQKDN